MILNSKETTIAYRCPNCGLGVISVVGVFSLSGDLLKLKCDCTHSELVITHTSDGMIRLSVPCLVCPKPHNFTISRTMLFTDEVFTLSCPYTAIDLCFIGSKDKVLEALGKSNSDLEAMLDDMGEDSLDNYRGSDAGGVFDDSTIEEIIRFMLAELREEKKISCACEKNTEAQYDFEFLPPEYDKIRIFCHTCGASCELPMTSLTNAHDFLDMDSLELK